MLPLRAPALSKRTSMNQCQHALARALARRKASYMRAMLETNLAAKREAAGASKMLSRHAAQEQRVAMSRAEASLLP